MKLSKILVLLKKMNVIFFNYKFNRKFLKIIRGNNLNLI